MVNDLTNLSDKFKHNTPLNIQLEDVLLDKGLAQFKYGGIIDAKIKLYKADTPQKKTILDFVMLDENEATVTKYLELIDYLARIFEIPSYKKEIKNDRSIYELIKYYGSIEIPYKKVIKNEPDILLGSNKEYKEPEKIISTEFCTKLDRIKYEEILEYKFKYGEIINTKIRLYNTNRSKKKTILNFVRLDESESTTQKLLEQIECLARIFKIPPYEKKIENDKDILGFINHYGLIKIPSKKEIENVSDLLLRLNKKYNELEKIISTEFCAKIDNITTLRVNKNQVYRINLNDDRTVVLKEFTPYNNQKFAIESFFTQMLNRKGLTPNSKRLRDKSPRQFTEFINGPSLNNLQDEGQLASYYNAAIDILLAIEDIDRQHRAQLRIKIPTVSEMELAKKYNLDEKNITTSNFTLIHENFYPEHVIIGADKKAKVIDCEHICYGPIELALARLLDNTFHNLGENFVQQQLEYYLSHKPKINKELFYKSFNIHKIAVQNMLFNMFDSILKTKPKNLDIDLVSAVYDVYKYKERN